MTTAAKQLEKENRKAKASHLERFFAFHLSGSGYENFVQEYRFAAIATGGTGKGVRKRLNAHRLKDWRFDFADIENKIAIEIEGGIWVGGRHVTGAGFRADAEKYNNAQVMGWTVLRFTDLEVKSGQAILMLNRLYEARQKEGALAVVPSCLT